MEGAKVLIENAFKELSGTLERTLDSLAFKIEDAALIIAGCLKAGGKVLFFGNGGSAADAQHLAAELMNRFQMERKPLAGIALTTDTSILTSVANDYSFDEVFEKQVSALGRAGDVAVGLSTSGTSKNVLRALEAARDMGLKTVMLTGRAGAPMEVDVLLSVDSAKTPRIQEAHILIGHILCELVEILVFEAND